MSYNWEGDIIIQDSIIEKKRFVIGGGKKQIRTDIREWISFEDNNILKEIIKGLEKNGLPKTKNPGDFDKRAWTIWDFVAKNLRYVPDPVKQRKEDFWLFPPEIHTLGKGDCEDGSFLLASLLIASGISPFCVRVVIGEVLDRKGGTSGHCWPVYRNEAGEWCILETTLEKAPAYFPEADRLVNYIPYYCFNNFHLWAILHNQNKSSGGLKVEGYLKKRPENIKVKRTDFASGGPLAFVTGPGHYEITEEVLKEFKFGDDAVSIVADASQDPDFYDWSKPRAHAQTDNYEDGNTSESKKDAVGNYISWIGGLNNTMISAAEKDPRHGLFYLGYILHGIQDLAAHKGLTNAQHSYLASLGDNENPDNNLESRKTAVGYSEEYLSTLKNRHGNVYKGLAGYKGRAFLWEKLLYQEKVLLLGRDWDFSPGEFIKYKRLAGKYKEIKNDNPIDLWGTDRVFQDVLAGLRP